MLTTALSGSGGCDREVLPDSRSASSSGSSLTAEAATPSARAAAASTSDPTDSPRWGDRAAERERGAGQHERPHGLAAVDDPGRGGERDERRALRLPAEPREAEH